MRMLQIIGAVLIAAGLYVLIRSPTFSSEESVFKVGDVEAKVQRHHDIPPWLGGAALAAGVVLVVVGAKKS
jgi:drug/metabolite transporter (DMT)-like permease